MIPHFLANNNVIGRFLFNEKIYRQIYDAHEFSFVTHNRWFLTTSWNANFKSWISNLSFISDMSMILCWLLLSPFLTIYMNKFNSFHPRLKFTIEIGGDVINFLDVTLIKRDGKLIFNWYQNQHFQANS